MKINILDSARAKTRAFAFTVTEAIFGVAIIGIVFVSLYTGMTTGFESIRDSQENLRATQIMTEKFEAMRLYNWSQIIDPGFIPETFTESYAPNSTKPGITYTGTIRIFNAGTEPYMTDLRGVHITLTWTSGGRANRRTLSSFVARYGLQNYVY